MTRSELTIRENLLCEVALFVERVRVCSGVQRIALIGSLTTNKENPKDADVLVTVDDDADLTPLATACRRLKGHAQSRNKGTDIFLANPSGNYIGRICHWRECRPGIRASCDARHCGRRSVRTPSTALRSRTQPRRCSGARRSAKRLFAPLSSRC